jgi:hypothetical protein
LAEKQSCCKRQQFIFCVYLPILWGDQVAIHIAAGSHGATNQIQQNPINKTFTLRIRWTYRLLSLSIADNAESGTLAFYINNPDTAQVLLAATDNKVLYERRKSRLSFSLF